MAPNYILEAPITSKDARRRRLPRYVSKLIIAFEGARQQEQERAIRFFCETLGRLRDNDQKVYAQPIGSHYHLDRYETELKEEGIRYWFDNEYERGKRKKPNLLTMECDTDAKIRAVFSGFKSEAIVFSLAKQYLPGGQLEKTLAKRRFGHGYEEYYLKEIDSYRLFAFFEDGGLSLELIGHRDAILKAFSAALAVEKEIQS